VKRALNYASFAASVSLLAPWLIHRPDVIFVYHPPLTLGLPGAWLSAIWRAPMVYQIQDMWPETLAASRMLTSDRLLRVVGWLAKWVYARSHAICVISEGFRSNLLVKGVPGEKIHVISNWVDPQLYRLEQADPALADELGLARRFNVMFAGNVGEAQGLDTLLAASTHLRDLPGIQFVIVGDGTALEALRARAARETLDNILFLGRFPVERMSSLYALADVLVVHLRDDPLFRITVPHKTFAYMASAKPVLAALRGDGAKVVADARAGVVCEPEHPRALADTVRELYLMSPDARAAMGRRGRQAITERYSRERIVGEIEAVLRRATQAKLP
jgi:glycosyltransferase involved in cell wall biosynthesis